ncbi:MAG: ubiquinol-cytochrome c reductase iron-sulfur subunit [Gemmatimonadales bacterium]
MSQQELDAGCRACARSAERAAGANEAADVDAGRREFLKQSAAALALMALAACGLSDTTAPSSLASTTIDLSTTPALTPVGGVAVLTIGGSPVAVVHASASSYSAFSLICPHAGNTVQSVGAQGFYCPGHGARFDLAGDWIGGQRTSNLRSYPARYDAAAGTVTIGG